MHSPWLEIIGLAMAAFALLVACRANAHSKHANRVAEHANELAERSVRASKLPSVERVREEFRKLVPELQRSPHGRIGQLDHVADQARQIARESLGPPFDRLRTALQQLPPKSGGVDDDWGHSTFANRPVGEDDWAAVQECIDDVSEAFEEFINR